MAPKSKSKSAAKSGPAESQTPPKSVLPNWPVLSPVLSSTDLTVEETLRDQILVIRNLFTSTLCKALTSFLSTLPLVTTPGKPKRGEATRVNDRFQVSDQAFAERLWSQTALKDLVLSYHDQAIFGGEVLGLNPNIRVYRYTPGQFFDQHYDESNQLSFVAASGSGSGSVLARTTWTLLVYLTTCEGGETIFYPEAKSRRERPPNPIVCGLEVGMALLHRHGDECMLHEGSEVKSGEKWVLRSDLVVKR